jgi:hypothetical protein
MAEKITAGAILIKEGTLLPESLKLKSEPYVKGWRLVKNLESSGMDRKLCEAGWTFFFMAGVVKATAVGSDSNKMIRRAIKEVCTGMKSDKLNCLEIARVSTKRFVGLPYVTVSAHLRHIQEGIVLFHSRRLAEWDKAKLGAA